MSIEEDVKALREALADRTNNLPTNSVSDRLEALRARRDWLGNLSALCTPERISRLLAELEARGKDAERMSEALKRIATWHGEFPETGHFWDDDPLKPMSYSAAFGSNGERDYMRVVATASLSKGAQEGVSRG